MNHTKCIVCGSRGSRPLYKGVCQCGNCGYVYADLNMSQGEFEELYKKGYFFGEEYSDYIADKDILQKNFKLRLKVLENFIESQRHRTLLEIGCAYGFFLDLVRNRFGTVKGIDVAEDGVRYARDTLGLHAIQGDFLEKEFGDEQFDVICLWDTIEHLRSPHLYVEKAGNLMESGGLLAITTGDIGSLNARVKGASWRLMHPPTHAHYFSKKSLTQMLNNYGFEVLYNRYCGFYRSIDNMAYNMLVLRGQGKHLYSLLKKTSLGNSDIYLNLFDIMYVIARKR